MKSLKGQGGQVPGNYGVLATDLVNAVDNAMTRKATALESEILLESVKANLSIPSLLGLVISEATSRDDVLDVAIQVRGRTEVKLLRRLLTECVGDVRKSSEYMRAVNEAKRAVDSLAGEPRARKWSLSWGLQAVFASLSISVDDFLVGRERYVIFLRDLARCRAEMNGVQRHLKRVFGVTEADLNDVARPTS